MFITRRAFDDTVKILMSTTDRLNDKCNETHMRVMILEKEVESLKTLINLLMGNQKNVLNNDTDHENFDKLGKLQRKMDAQIGTVSDNVLRTPRDIEEYLKSRASNSQKPG